jgi:UDP-N-acetylmuramate dehydrogenase
MSKPLFKRGVPLSSHTTFRIGGPAQAFFVANSTDAVVEATWRAEGMGLPWQVIGHGSNILASDKGYPGAIIVFKDESASLINTDGTITVSGGLALSKLVDFTAHAGLGGFEDLAGIPGTVGGAIAGNAGAYGRAIGDRVISVLLLDRNGSVHKACREDIKFSYRWSSIKENGSVILEATLSADSRNPAEIEGMIQARLEDRGGKHPDPTVVGTAGSFFKNPTDEDGRRIAAGKLLEEAGCQDLKVGGATLWHAHANIIVTSGSATARDVRELATRMATMVSEHSGIELTPEVSFLGQH